ncbi:hypothetical protein RHMOL_Rhmol01G0142500 [Rhododendron molle]|uniref:Uncharacterized protein n=1 Tax=Rhododendron molle TaxID=49168 RepID=A0ACC0Q144_RHOML|nr:hypothetical protein RHMOL_Rhmol01G0142500 [Rhododendron molle]
MDHLTNLTIGAHQLEVTLETMTIQLMEKPDYIVTILAEIRDFKRVQRHTSTLVEDDPWFPMMFPILCAFYGFFGVLPPMENFMYGEEETGDEKVADKATKEGEANGSKDEPEEDEMSNPRRRGCLPFTPRTRANYQSLLAPEYNGPTLPHVDDMELYEVPITWEEPPPVAIPENLPPTQVLAPHTEDFEQPFSFSTFGLETDPELEMAMLGFSQYYPEPLEEPPVLTWEEILKQEREYFQKAKIEAEKNYKKWLREMFGIILPQIVVAM